MPSYRHKRSGKVVTVLDRDAHRYRGSNFELVDPAASPAPAGPVSEVPAGTAAEVLAWVGNDEDRRAAALAAEHAGKQRKTLISSLGG